MGVVSEKVPETSDLPTNPKDSVGKSTNLYEDKMRSSTAAWLALLISLLALAIVSGGFLHNILIKDSEPPSPPPPITPPQDETPTATPQGTEPGGTEPVEDTETPPDLTRTKPPTPPSRTPNIPVLPGKLTPLTILVAVCAFVLALSTFSVSVAGFVSHVKEMEAGIPFLDENYSEDILPQRGSWYYIILGSILAWLILPAAILVSFYSGLFRTISTISIVTLVFYWILTPYSTRRDLKATLKTNVRLSGQIFWSATMIFPFVGAVIYIILREKAMEEAK